MFVAKAKPSNYIFWQMDFLTSSELQQHLDSNEKTQDEYCFAHFYNLFLISPFYWKNIYKHDHPNNYLKWSQNLYQANAFVFFLLNKDLIVL